MQVIKRAWRDFLTDESGMGVVEIILIIVVLIYITGLGSIADSTHRIHYRLLGRRLLAVQLFIFIL